MAITTIRAHVNRAKDFFKREDLYFAIGKSTPWNGNDATVPVPAETDLALQEIIGYKKVEAKHLVVPDSSGTIEYREGKYKILPEAEALTRGAKWVYIDTVIKYDELPLGQYRQVGLYSGLVKKAGIPVGKNNLLPSEVENAGVLEVIDHRGATTRSEDQKERLSLIIEF